MVLDTSKVGTATAPRVNSWTSKDALLYALGVGCGAQDPLQDLSFTTENSTGIPQQVLPTFATVMATGEAKSEHPLAVLGEVGRAAILHGSQKIVLRRDIPADGTCRSEGRLSAIWDKGKHASVEFTSVIVDDETGEPYADVESSMIILGAGGFGGESGPKSAWTIPDRTPDELVSYATRTDQGLLYRLSGDRNPLHSDPTFARRAGRDKPILHGLCTYGFAGRALLAAIAENDTSRFGEFSARFAAPVLPGDTLDTYIWRTDDGAVFQTRVDDTVVLDHGVFRLR
jgi:acyl dehydratase